MKNTITSNNLIENRSGVHDSRSSKNREVGSSLSERCMISGIHQTKRSRTKNEMDPIRWRARAEMKRAGLGETRKVVEARWKGDEQQQPWQNSSLGRIVSTPSALLWFTTKEYYDPTQNNSNGNKCCPCLRGSGTLGIQFTEILMANGSCSVYITARLILTPQISLVIILI